MFWQVSAFATVAMSFFLTLKWGGIDEKIAALGLVIAVIVTNIVTDGRYDHTETNVLVVDISVFFGLLVLAMRSDRFWPMWAAAFQLVATMVHIGSISQTGDFSWAYYFALTFWSFPVFIALMAGTWLECRGRRAWEISVR